MSHFNYLCVTKKFELLSTSVCEINASVQVTNERNILNLPKESVYTVLHRM